MILSGIAAIHWPQTIRQKNIFGEHRAKLYISNVSERLNFRLKDHVLLFRVTDFRDEC